MQRLPLSCCLFVYAISCGFALPAAARDHFVTGHGNAGSIQQGSLFHDHFAQALEPRFSKQARALQMRYTQAKRHMAETRQRQRSMSEAIAVAKKRVPGEVVSAKKQVNKKGEGIYYIKILSRKGVVRTVRVQAAGK